MLQYEISYESQVGVEHKLCLFSHHSNVKISVTNILGLTLWVMPETRIILWGIYTGYWHVPIAIGTCQLELARAN